MRAPAVGGLLAAALLLNPAPAFAGGSEWAYAQTIGLSPVFDGLKGRMEIRTDPATVATATYLHITQADPGPLDNDFIAIGTSNGHGVDHCDDDFDPLWSGYYDGRMGGLYFCWDFSPDAFGVGANPSFQIYHTTCPFWAQTLWVVSFNGTALDCVNLGSNSAQYLTVGLEVRTDPFDATDRNIDVKYTQLFRNQTNGANWIELGHPPMSDVYLDQSYKWQWVSNTAQNFYLGVLN